jgi:hypothetical protein
MATDGICKSYGILYRKFQRGKREITCFAGLGSSDSINSDGQAVLLRAYFVTPSQNGIKCGEKEAPGDIVGLAISIGGGQHDSATSSRSWVKVPARLSEFNRHKKNALRMADWTVVPRAFAGIFKA